MLIIMFKGAHCWTQCRASLIHLKHVKFF